VRRLRVQEQRRASVHMAPSRQGSVTWHGLADSAKGRTRAARAQARRRTRREVTNAVKGREAAKARGKQEPAGQGAMQSGSERTQKRQEVNGDIGLPRARTVTHCLRVQWLRPFLAKMLTGAKQLLMRSSRRARRLECGRIASCQQVSRPCQVGLFLGGNGMGATRRAWWWGGTGSSMGWTLRTRLLPCVHTRQCA
jgi:hypothetical protein